MRAVDFVVCAAGAGTRLSGHFHGRPKPLIKWRGRTLLELSLDSLDLFEGDRLIVIGQKQHGLKSALEKTLADRYPDNQVVWAEVGGLTAGQLATALAARDVFSGSRSIAIFNSDTYFRSISLTSRMRDNPPDGLILCQKLPDRSKSHFSFCRTDGSDKVLEVAEKVAISEWASVGLYFFRDKKTLLRYADRQIESKDGLKEKFVIPVYQPMINDGLDVRLVASETFKPMGTPEDFEAYWSTKLDSLSQENPRGTIVVDLDGTLTIEDPALDYSKKKPNTLMIERLRELKSAGYSIILHTARRMRTYGADEAKVMKDVGLTTLEWLETHRVPYDGLRFGKPFCENGLIVDDMAVRPTEFLQTDVTELQRRLDEERRKLTALSLAKET